MSATKRHPRKTVALRGCPRGMFMCSTLCPDFEDTPLCFFCHAVWPLESRGKRGRYGHGGRRKPARRRRNATDR